MTKMKISDLAMGAISIILTVSLTIALSGFAFAEQNGNSQESNGDITIGIDLEQQAQQPISCENGLFTYANGTMKIDVVGATFSGEANSVSVESPANVTVTLTPNEGYVVSDLMDAGQTVGPLSGDFLKTYQNSNVVNNCAFEPFFIQDQPGPEPEPVPPVDQGKIKINAQGYNLGTIAYKIGDQGSFNTMFSDSKTLTSTDMGAATYVFLKVEPNDNNIINKEYTKVSDGSQYIDVDYDQLIAGTYKLNYDPNKDNGQCADLGIIETRQITINLTEASKDMITQNLTLIAGHGDRNDVKVTTPSPSNTLYVDKGTEQKLILSFAIKNGKYFIPSITVNNQVYSTVDTGMTDEDGNLIICSTLEGSAARVNSFQVDLSVYAQLICKNNSETMEIVKDLTKYEYMKDGQVVNNGTYSLTGSDTENDPSVNDAIATYDLSLEKDGVATGEITGGIETHLLLDATVFTEEEYKVVRNHEGQVEALDTTCGVVRNPGTGEVIGIEVAFNSDKFSDYSIVPANWQPVNPDQPSNPSETSFASAGTNIETNTGDNLIAIYVLGIAIMTGLFSLAVYSRKRHSNKHYIGKHIL